jgi:hypothetical protein
MTQAPLEEFCGHCGGERKNALHDRCDRAALLEPPRFCVACRRRMLVQVTPTGWTARCSRHGEVSSDRA